MTYLSRRNFLRESLIGLASIVSAVSYTFNSYSQNKDEVIEYTQVRERTATKLGTATVHVEFGLESKLWETLKPNLDIKEFYNTIKSFP